MITFSLTASTLLLLAASFVISVSAVTSAAYWLGWHLGNRSGRRVVVNLRQDHPLEVLDPEAPRSEKVLERLKRRLGERYEAEAK